MGEHRILHAFPSQHDCRDRPDDLYLCLEHSFVVWRRTNFHLVGHDFRGLQLDSVEFQDPLVMWLASYQLSELQRPDA